MESRNSLLAVLEAAAAERPWAYRGLLVWGCLLFLIVTYLPGALRGEVYQHDALQQLPYVFRWHDPGLFPNDLAVDYWERHSMTPVRELLYRAGIAWIEPQLFSELLGMVLGGVVLGLSYAVGAAAARHRRCGGLLAVAITIGAALTLELRTFYSTTVGGFSRAFAWPVLLLAVHGLLRRRYAETGAAVLLGSASYPPAAVLAGACAAFTLLGRWRLSRAEARLWIPQLALPTLLAVALLGLLYRGDPSPAFGARIGLEEALTMPEYREGDLPHGGMPALLSAPSIGETMLRDRFGADLPLALGLGLLALTAACVPRLREACGVVAALGLGGWAAYVLAYLAFPWLYEPTRFSGYGYRLCTVLSFTLAAIGLAEWGPGRCRLPLRVPARLPGALWGLALAAALLAGVGAAAATLQRYRAFVGGVRSPLPDSMLEALRQLPPDALVAAHPDDGADIPLRARRSALVIRLYLYPYHRRYYDEMKQRVDDTLSAHYASDWERVDALAHRYGARFLLVDRRRLGDLSDRWLRWRPDLYRQARDARERGFVLESPPAQRIAARSDELLLVRLRGPPGP